MPPIPAPLDDLARRTGHVPVAVEALPGDVGRRRYFRLRLADNRTVLGVVYPEEEQDSRRRWVKARAAFADLVRVPTLIADDENGNQLVEDLGAADLAARLEGRPAERAVWLSRAAKTAGRIAGASDPDVNPAFDSALFRRELDLAREAVFDMHLGAPLSPEEREVHDAWAQALVGEILSHPFVLCHRDFHGNNLFPVGDAIGMIDFQDCRRGPDTYDVASLLWERSTLDWMSDAIEGEAVREFAAQRSVPAGPLRERLRRVLLQRAWKVCGTFARAVHRGKGDAYRRFLPAEIALVQRLLMDSEEDRRFAALLRAKTAGVC